MLNQKQYISLINFHLAESYDDLQEIYNLNETNIISKEDYIKAKRMIKELTILAEQWRQNAK